MKRAILTQRLPHLLMCGLLTALVVASSVVLPSTPAQAADKYFVDGSISDNLSYKDSRYQGEQEDLSKHYYTDSSTKICEKLISEADTYIKETAKRYHEELGVSNRQVENCRLEGSIFFIDYSAKYDEKLLKKTTVDGAPKINANGDLVWKTPTFTPREERDLKKIGMRENIGFLRLTFPGKILSVTPEVGKISGNTWTLDRPLTATEREKVQQSNHVITITAERHGSKLGLILGITIPATLIIVAVIVLLIVRNNRKKKQPNLPPYQAGYGAYPPPPFIPGNSPYPSQPRIPGYPASDTPGVPGAAPYPPNVPPPGQPGAVPYPPNVPPPAQPAAPMPGGYYPYPYPYPPANPQGSPAGHPMPPQSYGTPAPGFQPPATPPQPAPAEGSEKSEPATESHSGKQVANSPQPGQSGKPAKSLASTQSEEEDGTGNPDGSNQASDSHQPKHAVEPAQADLTVLKTDPSEAITPQHSNPAKQAEQPGQEN